MFEDYFKTHQEYPNPTELDILPVNCQYLYITNTFLNGFINYVTIIKAFLITRYEPFSKNLKSVLIFHDESINKVHTNINKFFNDDIVILAVSDFGDFWYFYYDQDTSDCSIGRFKTGDSEEKVIECFTKHCNDMSLSSSRAYADAEVCMEENLEGKEAIELNHYMFHKWLSS